MTIQEQLEKQAKLIRLVLKDFGHQDSEAHPLVELLDLDTEPQVSVNGGEFGYILQDGPDGKPWWTVYEAIAIPGNRDQPDDVDIRDHGCYPYPPLATDDVLRRIVLRRLGESVESHSMALDYGEEGED
jgi:hypothetical protein